MFAAHLLWTGVHRCKGADGSVRFPGSRLGNARENTRQAKIDEFGTALRRNQNIARRKVAVHNEVAGGVLDGIAHLAEQAEPVIHAKVVLLTKHIDRQPFHMLHDQVGNPVLRGTAVD